MTKQHPTSYAEKLKAGGNCVAFKKDKLPCALHGDRLVDGHWYCKEHEPHETTPDVPGQMTFAELISDEDAGDAMFHPPDKAQLHEASKRIKKWTAP